MKINANKTDPSQLFEDLRRRIEGYPQTRKRAFTKNNWLAFWFWTSQLLELWEMNVWCFSHPAYGILFSSSSKLRHTHYSQAYVYPDSTCLQLRVGFYAAVFSAPLFSRIIWMLLQFTKFVNLPWLSKVPQYSILWVDVVHSLYFNKSHNLFYIYWVKKSFLFKA